MPEVTSPPPPLRPTHLQRDLQRRRTRRRRPCCVPAIDKVRAKLGTGSPNTINPLLDAWWRKLRTRFHSGPAASPLWKANSWQLLHLADPWARRNFGRLNRKVRNARRGTPPLNNLSWPILRLAGPFVLSLHSPGNGEAGARARLASRNLGQGASIPLRCPYRKVPNQSDRRSPHVASSPPKTASWRDGIRP
jgi:hypothetical protein